MKYFLDTEFIERGHEEPIRLISIGLVCEDGREYYAEVEETDLTLADDWVKEHVIKHLTGPRKSRKQIAAEIVKFVTVSDGYTKDEPQFWAYFADYDWVLFCQLFGRMIDMPNGFPHLCYDLKQRANEVGLTHIFYPPKLYQPEHHALNDARWDRELARRLGVV